MAEAVFMPRLGQSVESCIITKWHKEKGDKVDEGDMLFSYETDKAAFDEAAKMSGILLEKFFEEGDEVPVLANVAVIGQKGDNVDSFRGEEGSEKPEAEEETRQEDAPAVIEKPEETHSQPTGDRIKISPRARNMASRHQVNLSLVAGTGPNGRIIARDIDKVLKEVRPTPPQAQKVTGIISGDDFSFQPLTGIRKIIASAMHASLQNSAQLTHHAGADARKILAMRAKFKAKAAEGNFPDITLNDMICYAVVKALQKLPQINSHFMDEGIKVFNKVHLGLAVDTERGLMVPALRNADDYNLKGLSSQLKSLTALCRKGSVDPDLLRSDAATFTISNLGALGVEMFTPVLNIPQAGILGVNTITYRPADLGDGTIGFVPYLGLSLTYDHRALDGAPASVFLKEVREQIAGFDADID